MNELTKNNQKIVKIKSELGEIKKNGINQRACDHKQQN